MNREEKKQETVNRIMNAAICLFTEKGYEATTVAEITKMAGVAKGTFFNYFKTKDELLIKFQKELFFNELKTLHDKPAPYTPRLLALIKEMGDSMDENRTQMRLSLQHFLTKHAIEPDDGYIKAKMESMILVFEKGQQAGEFTTDITSTMMARTAMQLYLGALIIWCTDTKSDRLSEQLLTSFHIFLEGIKQDSV